MTNTVLITGCSSGFGEAAAHLFADRGWNVVATMRRPESGGSLAALQNVIVARLDVQDSGSIESAITEGIQRFGRIDAVVNNAGFGLYGIFEAIPQEKILEQFDVNVFGPMRVIRAILPHFRARRIGTIVNISSGMGVFGLPTGSPYNASKFALEGFSEALHYELAAVGVTVKVVEPGAVPSTKFPARSDAETWLAQIPHEYAPFLEATKEVFAGFADRTDDGALGKVVEAIFAAVTDGTDRFRYLPTDDIKPLVTARRESSEAEYIALMRSLFLPKNITASRLGGEQNE
jgi:NAD(P)-dependent dehydrogenase (short-subunit alcohol dehydrogenase family)